MTTQPGPRPTLPDVAIRCRSHQVLLGVLTALSSIVTAVWIVTAFTLSEVPARVLLAAIFGALSVCALRSARADVVFAYDRRVVILRNALRTVTVSFDDVSGFELGWSRMPNSARRSLVKLIRDDRATFVCTGASAMSLAGNGRMMEQLDAAFADRRLSR